VAENLSPAPSPRSGLIFQGRAHLIFGGRLPDFWWRRVEALKALTDDAVDRKCLRESQASQKADRKRLRGSGDAADRNSLGEGGQEESQGAVSKTEHLRF
jgi:hypothetical protein